MISFTERFLGAESFTVTDSNYRSRTGQTVDVGQNPWEKHT